MFNEAVGLDPDFARAHATLGRCYVLHAQGYGGPEYFVLAERSLQARARDSSPTSSTRGCRWSTWTCTSGDKEQGPRARRRAAAERPDDPSVLFVAGMLYRLDGLYEKALAEYDRLLEVNPQDVVIVAYNKARIYTHQDHYERAVAELDRGRAAEPDHPLLKTFLAVALLNQGMVDDAQALLEDVRGRTRTSTACCRCSPGASRRAGSTRGARRSSATACARSPPPTTTSRCGWRRSTRWRAWSSEALEWVQRARQARQRELPLVRAHAQARCAAHGPPLRRARSRSCAGGWEARRHGAEAA